MFFALIVLRPASGPLDPGVRLALWLRVFSGFFPWVFAAIGLLLISGFTLLLGGYAGGPHVHAMITIGILMMLIFFLYLFFAPWKALPGGAGGGRQYRRGGAAQPDPHSGDESKSGSSA